MKILVVRFSSIGDVVLTTPVVRALKQQLENSEIHFVTKKPFASILENNPYVSKVYAIDKSIDECIADLKLEEYDHVVDLHNNLRTQGLKKKLRRSSSTFQKLNLKKWMLVKWKIDKMPDLHVVDRYYEAVRSLGVKPDGLPGDFFIPEGDEVDVKREFSLDSGSYLTIAIGAQFKTKCMPEDLLLNIIEKATLPVVLIGGKMDHDLGESIVRKSSGKVINACGKYNLSGSASIVKQSRRLLTNDTGMMHIAACLDVNISSVWGNTVPSLGMYPYYPHQNEKFTMHEVKDLSCRPCSKIGYQKCPKGHFKCMKDQDLNAILNNLL